LRKNQSRYYGIDKNLADRARKTGAMPEADRTLAA
jgi:hypothetical protein